MELVKATGLTKHYGNRRVVDGISLSIGPGEVLAIIGPNGAGKTTTVEMLMGLRQPDEGTVAYWCDNPKQQMGIQLQQTPYFPGLSAKENLRLFAALYGMRLSEEEVMMTLSRCGLKDSAATEALKLSGGQQKRLGIALSLVHQPKLIFLDEPTSDLDPRARREIHNLVRTLAKEGTAVVFTSHDMEEVGKLADMVILITEGQVVASGSPEELMDRYQTANLEELFLQFTPGEVC